MEGYPFQTPLQRNGPVTLTFRPEALQPVETKANAFRAVTRGVTFGGTYRHYDLEADGLKLVRHTPPALRFEVGDNVMLHCPPQSCWTIPAER